MENLHYKFKMDSGFINQQLTLYGLIDWFYSDPYKSGFYIHLMIKIASLFEYCLYLRLETTFSSSLKG